MGSGAGDDRQTRLEAELARHTAIVDTMRDAVIETDRDHRILRWNRAAERMYGWTSAEVAGRAVADVLQTEFADGHRECIVDELAAEGHVLVVARQRTRSGAPIEVEASVIELRDAAGELTGYIASNRDISHRHRLEQRLRETHHLEVVGRLAGGVAHDLNTQLTAILGYTDLSLADPGLPEHVRPDLRQIARAAERSGELTRQLLAFSRRQMLAPRRLDLNAVIASTTDVRRRLAGSDVELVDRPGVDVASVMMDPTQLEQVLLDIVTNAREAMPDGGRLVLESAMATADGSEPDLPAGTYVRLMLTDTGAGMDADVRESAFEPFFTTKPGHTGLGLSTVYGTVGQSGGHVVLASEPGAGTTVTLYLPAVTPSG